MKNPTPEDRAFRVFQIYQDIEDNDEDTEETITSLLTDLFHFSDEMDFEMQDCIRYATYIYNTQKGHYSPR